MRQEKASMKNTGAWELVMRQEKASMKNYCTQVYIEIGSDKIILFHVSFSMLLKS